MNSKRKNEDNSVRCAGCGKVIAYINENGEIEIKCRTCKRTLIVARIADIPVRTAKVKRTTIE